MLPQFDPANAEALNSVRQQTRPRQSRPRRNNQRCEFWARLTPSPGNRCRISSGQHEEWTSATAGMRGYVGNRTLTNADQRIRHDRTRSSAKASSTARAHRASLIRGCPDQCDATSDRAVDRRGHARRRGRHTGLERRTTGHVGRCRPQRRARSGYGQAGDGPGITQRNRGPLLGRAEKLDVSVRKAPGPSAWHRGDTGRHTRVCCATRSRGDPQSPPRPADEAPHARQQLGNDWVERC
jgi:hypothetical protein